MHELSIAQNILEIALQYLPRGQEAMLRSVKLRVGSQAGIVTDSLCFSWEVITADSPVAGAVLNIETVPFTVRCQSCGATSSPEEGTVVCSACGSVSTNITGGTELKVTELELADAPREVP